MIIHFQNYITLDTNQKKQILDGRNSTRIRLNSISQEIISWEHHCKWMKTLETRRDALYYMVYCDSVFVGNVSFTNLDFDSHTAEWGFDIGPSSMGYGCLIETLAVEHSFRDMAMDKLFCRVLDNNKKTLRMHNEHFYFSLDSEYDGSVQTAEGVIPVWGMSLKREVFEKKYPPLLEFVRSAFHIKQVVWDD